MKRFVFIALVTLVFAGKAFGQDTAFVNPDIHSKGWKPLFDKKLSNAIYPDSVWSIDKEGVMTATKDEAIWSNEAYDDFVLDLEFKNAPGTNSGVIVHASDMKEWIPHSVEIQIADDYSHEWANVNPNWQCAAIFGHQAATKRTVKPAGEWNRYTITCIGRKIWVVLNGELVNTCDMSLYTTGRQNTDGSLAPEWLPNPMASLPLRGHIGFQGKHAGAPIYFRHIMIKKL